MRIAFIGGTRFVGPAALPHLRRGGNEVAVAHSGAHEHPAARGCEHLHGERAQLLAPAGPVERWRPGVLVDTFPGGAGEAMAAELAGCAARSGARIVAISSIDVYRYTLEAGLGDGSGAVDLPGEPLPLPESARLRDGPYPGARHDNAAMEQVLAASGLDVAVLRPGAIYGPHAATREWEVVRRVHRGERRLELPDRGVQLFHRVAVERVGRAIAAAAERAPAGFWACNVVDPYDWSYAGLAAEIGRLLGWNWEPVGVPFAQDVHPWQTFHPVLCEDRRLREVLGVTEPDPREALAETVAWLWERRGELDD